jgi:hypothetical protein
MVEILIGIESYPSALEGSILQFLFYHADSADIHLCSGILTLFEEGSSDPSRVSSIPPSHDSYGIPNKNQIILSVTYRIPNFALTNL